MEFDNFCVNQIELVSRISYITADSDGYKVIKLPGVTKSIVEHLLEHLFSETGM